MIIQIIKLKSNLPEAELLEIATSVSPGLKPFPDSFRSTMRILRTQVNMPVSTSGNRGRHSRNSGSQSLPLVFQKLTNSSKHRKLKSQT